MIDDECGFDGSVWFFRHFENSKISYRIDSWQPQRSDRGLQECREKYR